MENAQKLEIVNALIEKLDIAHETTGGAVYSDAKKIILDIMPTISTQEHRIILQELKEENALEDFTKDNDCFYALHANKSKLYQIQKALRPAPTQQANGPRTLSFDTNIGTINLGDKKCELPFKSIEHYIAEALFQKPSGTRITEDDLISYIDVVASKADNPSRVYDAVRRINQKAHKSLGIENLIQTRGSHFWLQHIE